MMPATIQNHALMHSVLHWIVSAVALLITAYFVPGFNVGNFGSALIAAVVIGLANAVVWPILMALTLPLNVLTFGLFTFVVNAAVLKLCAAILPSFSIETWGVAILGAVILSIVSTILHYLLA